MARSITFTIEAEVLTEITITENLDGTLTFDIRVLDGGLIGDLRALFFDLEGLTSDASLSVLGSTDVTDTAFDDEGVDSLGRDANIKGAVINELGEFDVGIEFGTAGIAEDDIQATSFVLAHDTVALSLDMIDLADFGVRYTSVGVDGGMRDGSVKAGDQAAGVARNDALLVLENGSGSVDLLFNDTGAASVAVTGADDADGTFAAVAGGFERAVVLNGLALGTLFVGADGVAAFAADGPDADRLAEGEMVSLSFSYHTVAPDGSLATADVTLTVQGVNDAPTLAAGALTADEDGAAVTLDLAALGADIDGDDDGATLTYSIIGAPAEGSASISGTVLTFDPGAGFQDLNDGETRDVVITVQATDSHGATATANVTVTVNGETDNLPPFAQPDVIWTDEDTLLTGNLLADNGQGADGDPDGNAISIHQVRLYDGTIIPIGVASVLPLGATLTVQANGDFVYDPRGTFDYLPGGSASGNVFYYSVVDEFGAVSDEVSVHLQVQGINDAPVAGDDNLEAIEDAALALTTVDLLANDSDPDVFATLAVSQINGQAVTEGAVIATANGQVTVGAGGALSYQANEHFSGADSFDYTLSDGLATDTGTATVTVAAVADAPVLTLTGSGGGSDPTPVPLGADTQINTTTADVQRNPSVTALADGGFVVVWDSNGQDGHREGVYMQRYDANGVAIGGEVQVNTFTAEAQRYADVQALPDGGFIVAWTSTNDQDGSGDGVYMQRFGADGSPVGGETLVNTTTANSQLNPGIALLDGGGFVVTWMGYANDPTGLNVHAQTYDAAGAKVGGEVEVNTTVAGTQINPAVAGLADGGYVVTYTSYSVAGQYQVLAQRMNADGTKDGAEVHLNTVTSTIATHSSVLATGDGGYIAVWAQKDASGNPKVLMSHIAADGSAVFSEVKVNLTDATVQFAPEIVALDDGGFLVTWAAVNPTDSSGGMFARRFDTDGNPLSGEVLVNSTLAGQQHPVSSSGNSTLATLADGNVVLVWGTDHGSGELFFRIMDVPALSDGTEGQPFGLNLDAALVDADGSETLTVTLSGFPAGSTFSLGASAGADWVIANAGALDLSTLEMTTPEGFSGTFTLTATARATEASNGDFAETSATVDLVIAALPKPPLFTEGVDLINFGNPAAGSFGLVTAGSYEDGTQYDALGGDDDVYLPLTLADAAAAGYDLSHAFNLGAGNDFLRGSLLDDYILGGAGDDRLDGNDGNDTLLGEAGREIILGGAGDDYMDGGADRDIVDFRFSPNGIALDIAAGTAVGNGSDRVLNFESYRMSEFDDTVTGGASNDEIWLRAGNDWVDAGAGDDVVLSGEGDSTLEGGTGRDRISYQERTEAVNVDLSAGTATGSGVNDLLSGFEQAYGGRGDDTITGDAAANDLRGDQGDDTLTGGGGADAFYHFGAADGIDTITDFDPTQDRIYMSGNAADYVYDPLTGSLLHATGGYGVIFADPATRPDAVSYDGSEVIFNTGTFVSNGGAIQAETVNTISTGTSGAARMISVASDGTMALAATLANGGGYAYGTAMGDINGDGLDDLVMSGDWSGARIYYADGAGGWVNSGVNIAGQFQSHVEIADIDNDGDGDVYLQNGLGAAEVWRNDGGAFTNVFSHTSVAVDDSPYRTSGDATFLDVNGDGAVDMLINEIQSTVPIADRLFLNDGAGNFTASGSVLPTMTGYSAARLADVNGDGAVDYVTGTATGIFVALNDGAGNFASAVGDLGAAFNGDIELADFNGDGFLDALRNDPNGGAGLELWLGDGTDAFVFDSLIAAAATYFGGGVSVGDFSGDGIADVVQILPGEIRTLVNDGFGNFTPGDSLALSGFVFGEDVGFV